MKRFLKNEDYESSITVNKLNLLTSGVESTLLTAESQAMGVFTQYIGKKYDVQAIFELMEDAQGNDIRDQFIVKLLLDIAIYLLYRKLAPDQIPEHRKFDYQEALEYLRAVGKGDIDTFFKLKEIDLTDNFTEIKINSYPKNDHRY